MGQKIELGDTVKCIHTGFKGVALSRTEFFNGCVQYVVAPKWDGKVTDVIDMGIDEGSLVVIKKGSRHKPKPKKDPPGGPSRLVCKQRGY